MADSLEKAPPQIPLIDLSELDGPRHDPVAEALVKAAETSGFIHVVNHGVPDGFLEELKDLVHRFHNQSEEKKMAYLQEVRPNHLTTFLPRAVSRNSMDIMFLKYTNEEDAMKFWPDSCKEAPLRYVETASKLAERILRVLMSNLGVTLDESLVDAYMGGKYFLMNYYPPCRDQIIAKHKDSSTLTILLQDHIGGLFCKLGEEGDMEGNYKGEWVEIKPKPGALVIIVGESLQVLSDGKYKASEHYAVAPTGTEPRVSLPIVVQPKFTRKIQPLGQMIEKDGIKYEEFSFGRYDEYAYSLSLAQSSLLAL